MKRYIPFGITAIIIGLAIIFQKNEPVPNPDPNHTHVDFAVFINGQQLDFSDPKYMSEVYDPNGTEVRTDPMRRFLHLHDGNGNVIHRHKPGLTLEDFFRSIDISCVGNEWSAPSFAPENYRVRIFVNDSELSEGSSGCGYLFEDGDRILITNAENDEEISDQLSQLSDDACRYSRTCPWRGDPPTENCIADPEVPCVLPE